MADAGIISEGGGGGGGERRDTPTPPTSHKSTRATSRLAGGAILSLPSLRHEPRVRTVCSRSPLHPQPVKKKKKKNGAFWGKKEKKKIPVAAVLTRR